jgi:nucleoside-diphosphate-sugar epimerase
VRAALERRPLRVYGDGSQTRTFCYVDDTVETCIRAHDTGLYENDVINVGSDVEITIRDLAELVLRTTGSGSTIEFLPPLAEGDMTRRCPDVSKMRRLLDRELVPLEEGIDRLVKHFRSLGQPEPKAAQ